MIDILGSQNGFKGDQKDDLEEQIKIAHDKLEPKENLDKETESKVNEIENLEPKIEEPEPEEEEKEKAEKETETETTNEEFHEDLSDDDVIVRNSSNDIVEDNESGVKETDEKIIVVEEKEEEEEDNGFGEPTDLVHEERADPSTGDSGLDDTVHEDDQVCKI